MKKIKWKMLTLLLFLSVFIFSVEARQSRGISRVRPYITKRGSYVRPHFRTRPSQAIPRNNWSTKGNINPYTGQKGYANSYK